MTDQERITALEARLAQLEARLANLEIHKTVYGPITVVPQISQLIPAYTVTCGTAQDSSKAGHNET